MTSRSPIVAVALFLAASVGASAQIMWGSPTLITGDSNILTNGTYFDAINSTQGDGNNGVTFTTTTVGTTTFNPLVLVPNQSETTSTDGTITVSSNGGNYSTGQTFGGTAAYNYILNRGSDAVSGVITLGSATHQLIVGDLYQVEVWDSYGGSYTAHVDGSPALDFPGYQTNYAVGKFTAAASTFSFNYGPIANNSGAGFINDVVVRDLGVAPEPSTYALLLGGVPLLGLSLRRRMAQRG